MNTDPPTFDILSLPLICACVDCPTLRTLFGAKFYNCAETYSLSHNGPPKHRGRALFCIIIRECEVCRLQVHHNTLIELTACSPQLYSYRMYMYSHNQLPLLRMRTEAFAEYERNPEFYATLITKVGSMMTSGNCFYSNKHFLIAAHHLLLVMDPPQVR